MLLISILLFSLKELISLIYGYVLTNYLDYEINFRGRGSLSRQRPQCGQQLGWCGVVCGPPFELDCGALRTNASVRYAFDASVSITVEIIDLYNSDILFGCRGPHEAQSTPHAGKRDPLASGLESDW